MAAESASIGMASGVEVGANDLAHRQPPIGGETPTAEPTPAPEGDCGCSVQRNCSALGSTVDVHSSEAPMETFRIRPNEDSSLPELSCDFHLADSLESPSPSSNHKMDKRSLSEESCSARNDSHITDDRNQFSRKRT
jgi:hypothetical protein